MSNLSSEFFLFKKIGPSEEVICFYLISNPFKLLCFVLSTPPGPGWLMWLNETTKAAKVAEEQIQQNGYSDVICSKLALDTSKSFVCYLLLGQDYFTVDQMTPS